VKRKFTLYAGIAALVVAAYVGSRLRAQGTTGGRAPTLQTKVAVVNLPLVIKQYKKYQNYEKELETFAKGFQAQEEQIKGKANIAKTDTKIPQEEKEQKLKEFQRQLEDLSMQFKKEFSKKQEMQLVTLYQEVEDMVKRVAVSNNFEMVLQYSDAIDAKDKNNPMIIQRKVLGGVCVPMYAAPGLDISELVYKNLNWYYDHPPKAAGTH
jgi:Skp family chaperone for outer membrane proteins